MNVQDANNIESIIYIMKVITISIFPRNTTNLPLFAERNGLLRASMFCLGSQLHLNKAQHIPIPSNEVNLPERPAVFLCNDPITLAPQELIRQPFTTISLLWIRTA